MGKLIELMLYVNRAIGAVVNSLTLLSAGRRGGNYLLILVPIVIVGILSSLVILTVSVGIIAYTNSTAIGNGTLINLVTVLLAVSLNLFGLILVAGSVSNLLCSVITNLTLNDLYPSGLTIARFLNGNNLGIVSKHRKSVYAGSNPTLLISGKIDVLVAGSICGHTANGTAVELEAELSAGRISGSYRLAIKVVSVSCLDDNLCLGNDISLIDGKSAANGALGVSNVTVLGTGSNNCRNVNPGVSELSKSYVSLGSTVKRGSVAASALLVCLPAVRNAGSSLCLNVNSESMNAGSLEAGNVDMILYYKSGNDEGFGNNAFNNLCGSVANSALRITGACGAAGRSDGELAILNPVVTNGRLNYNLGALVGAIAALNNCNAVLFAVRSLNDLCNVAILAIVTSLCCVLNLVCTTLGCAPLGPSRNAVLAKSAYYLVVSDGVVDHRNLAGNLVTTVSAGDNLLTNLVASSGLNHYRLTVSVALVVGVSPVGYNGSLTSVTLVKVVTELTALGSYGLNERAVAVRKGVLFTYSRTLRSRGSLLGMIMYVNFCENGNNAAYAHNNGEQKSKNSFRIVLH